MMPCQVGFDLRILESFLRSVGFSDVEQVKSIVLEKTSGKDDGRSQVENFELFNDTSKMVLSLYHLHQG